MALIRWWWRFRVRAPRPACESCGADADLRLADGSMWCISCDIAARESGDANPTATLLRRRGR